MRPKTHVSLQMLYDSAICSMGTGVSVFRPSGLLRRPLDASPGNVVAGCSYHVIPQDSLGRGIRIFPGGLVVAPCK